METEKEQVLLIYHKNKPADYKFTPFPSTDETTVDLTKNQAGQCSTRGPSAEKGPVDPGSHGDQQ